MIADLKPYPAMKDSGVPWLGEVPEHWDVRRLRNAAEMRVSNVDKHTKVDELPVRLCNYVDVYKNDRIRDWMAFMRATATPEEIDRFRVETGDVLITKDSETWNDIGVPAIVEEPADDLICGYHLALLRPFHERLYGGYLFRALQSTAVSYQFHVEANGVTRYGLSHAAIKSIWLTLPPLPEQAAIVRFLDHADRRIRRYIRAKQKLIKLLEEQKQAIIHRAVTRGLDPNVRLKPSGVEWLGDVPEHWEVQRLKEVISRLEQGWSPQCDAQAARADEWGVLKVGCVNRDTFDASQNKRLPASLDPIPSLEIRDRDILVSRANTQQLLGLAALAVLPRGRLLLCDKLFRFRALPDAADAQYLTCAIRGRPSRAQIETSTNGASDSMQNIGQNVIRSLWIALPPLSEQREIVTSTIAGTCALARGIEHARREISLLREYRTRLIADVVTGKLDVREAAARLPDEPEQSAEFGEEEDTTDADGERAEDEADVEPAEA